jgi:hypothetical protein
MKFDYANLRGRIVAKKYNQAKLAEKLGITG